MPKKVLVACEFSGIVRDAFIEQGHDAISCDLLPSEKPGPHIQGDVRPLLKKPWDLVIAHPPCTRLCNSGVRWLHERNLWAELDEAAEFFLDCLQANSPHVAVENPIMHKYAKKLIGNDFSFSIQPWQFGDNYKKRTCFWTKNLPNLKPTSDLDGSSALAQVHMETRSKDRWKNRSRTYPGIAKAMAEQWGSI